MSGGSLCKVEGFKFPAGINHKLLFVIITMINTIHDISMPAENCTGLSDSIKSTAKTLAWVVPAATNCLSDNIFSQLDLLDLC